MEATSMDLFTVPWGSSGWYLGNVGNGRPSIQGGPQLWSKDNGNGYPTVRWTCPSSGLYNISGNFSGADSRGVDSLVYVVTNGATAFSGNVLGYQTVVPFTNITVSLTSRSKNPNAWKAPAINEAIVLVKTLFRIRIASLAYETGPAISINQKGKK